MTIKNNDTPIDSTADSKPAFDFKFASARANAPASANNGSDILDYATKTAPEFNFKAASIASVGGMNPILSKSLAREISIADHVLNTASTYVPGFVMKSLGGAAAAGAMSAAGIGTVSALIVGTGALAALVNTVLPPNTPRNKTNNTEIG